MTDNEKMKDAYNKVKALGFVPSNRSNNTGIGKTFEDYVGVVENNLKEPDLFGFEIKSQRSHSSSPVTLFTKSPTAPKKANNYLRDTYGVPYEDKPNLKRIHSSFYADRPNTYLNKYAFKLINDEENKVVRIGIHTVNDLNLIDDSVYYSYDSIEKAISKKLTNLFFVNAECKMIDGKEHFHFNKAELFYKFSIDKFLKLLHEGKIQYDIRIGSYNNPEKKNYGKTHDHGSGFRIKSKDIYDLYEIHEVIE